MIRRRMIRRWSLLALLVGLGWVPAAGAFAVDDVGDRQLGQSSFASRRQNLVDARGLSSPLDVAIDRSVTPNRLYVADTENSRVLGWSDAGAFVTGAPADLVIGQPDFASAECAPPSAANLCRPRGVAVDGFGNLYVADSERHRVLEYDTPFTSDAIADMVFGQGGDFTTQNCNRDTPIPDGLCTPTAVELDVANNLYVIDADDDRVLVYARPVLDDDTVPDLVIPEVCGAASATSLVRSARARGRRRRQLVHRGHRPQSRPRVRLAARERHDGRPRLRARREFHDQRLQRGRSERRQSLHAPRPRGGRRRQPVGCR